MIIFDPAALRAPLADLANRLQAEGAPAVMMELARGPFAARLAAGVADLGDDAAARPGQTFDPGSQAKMMTAVIVLQLAEEGRIDLDAPAATWLSPDEVAGVPNADVATVRQLLAMTGGVPNYTDAEDPATGLPRFVQALLAAPDRTFGPADALAIARDMPATGAPGEAFAYSNTGYLLLGDLIEAVTGAPLAEALEARIFAPAGMEASGARSLERDDPRLRSYATDPVTGDPIDVTYAPWALRGEGGVTTTTTDLIRFLDALLVNRTLLAPRSLDEMTRFAEFFEAEGASTAFGLGLARETTADGREFLGFSGLTLGTESSSFLDLATGGLATLAVTKSDVGSFGSLPALAATVDEAEAWAAPASLDGPVLVASGAAAELRLRSGADGLTLSLDGTRLTLPRSLAELAAEGVRFSDGSALVLGSAGADWFDLGRDNPAAEPRDDQLLGFGGDDRLAGGGGDDRLAGGRGHDRLFGGAGDDVLAGGAGADRLEGGAGHDVLAGGTGEDQLTGGSGADTFRFLAPSDSHAAGRDTILDFRPGDDRIDLAALDPGGDGDLVWIGHASFGGAAGQVRAQHVRCGVALEADLDGDGGADFTILLRALDAIGLADLAL